MKALLMNRIRNDTFHQRNCRKNNRNSMFGRANTDIHFMKIFSVQQETLIDSKIYILFVIYTKKVNFAILIAIEMITNVLGKIYISKLSSQIKSKTIA